ncbi:MAG TPA: hypothetical protein VGX00_02325 [Thermoplasmata archaeon]|nr:hypothetical protein [Thermoplasmata archaeon]
MPEAPTPVERWARPLTKTNLPAKDRSSIARAATVCQLPEDAIYEVFLDAANSPIAIEEARRLPGSASKWEEKTRTDYQVGRRTSAAWRAVWERWPEQHDRYTRDWADDNSARRAAGFNGKGGLNPWAGRDGWEVEPEIPIHHKDSKGHDGKYHRQPVEPGYVTYNRLVTELGFRPFRTASNEARVAVPSSHGLEIHNPADQDFPKRVGYALYTLHGEPIPFRDLTVAGTTLASRALSRSLPSSRVIELWLRVAPYEDNSSRIDMRDAAQRCIVVGPDGWRVEPVGDPTFDPRAHMLPLPNPEPQLEAGGWVRVDGLWDFVRLPEADGASDHRLLALACLVQFVLAPATPKPVVVFCGEEGIGKSTMAAFLQSLVDPSRVPLIKLPEKEEELVNIAMNHAVINFDNLSYISPDASDTISRLCTGIGLVKRELYSNSGEISLNVRRWVIVNGITASPRAPDLLRRVLFLDVQPPSRQLGAGVLDGMWARRHPTILAGLLDLACATARILRDAPPDPYPDSMADYLLVGRAMTVAMGRPVEDFVRAWERNAAARDEAVSEDPWISVLGEYFGRLKPGTGDARPDEVASWINHERKGAFGKEVSGQQVGNAVARSAKTLRRRGIAIVKRRGHGGGAVYYRGEAPPPLLEVGLTALTALTVRNPDNNSPNGGFEVVSPVRPQDFGGSPSQGGLTQTVSPENGGSPRSHPGAHPSRPSEDPPRVSPERPQSRKTGVEGGRAAEMGAVGPLPEESNLGSSRADLGRASRVLPTLGAEWANEACSRCASCHHDAGDPDCACGSCSPWGHSNTAVGSRTHYCGVLP